MTILLAFVVYAIALSTVLARRGLRASPEATPVTPVLPARPITRVLIIGATGGTGRQLVTQALERGYHVRALVRNPAAVTLTHPHLEVVQGDVLDPASLERAMPGVDAVLSALGHKRFFGPTRILSEGTRHVVRAMESAGVRRFVCETTLGLGDSAWRMGLSYTLFVIPVILPFYFYDKTRQERIVAASALEWVIVRPGALTDGPGTGAYRHGGRLGSFVGTHRISRADVADFMLAMVTDDAHLKTAVAVTA